MIVKQWLEVLLAGDSLNHADMTSMMQALMSGETSAAQTAALLTALRMKGETVEEISAAVSVMRALATHVPVDDQDNLIDTCGTGGDGQHTFNISTTVAFVVAAAGGRVAKHGGRSVTSTSGSADVLELAGMNLALSPAQVAACLAQTGVAFMFAPAHHDAMKHVVGVRRELGVRTMFNLLGPLTNPAGAKRQVLGVFSEQWLVPMAEVLQKLACRRAWVVTADDGLDEISIACATQVAEVQEDGTIHRFVVQPEDVGYVRSQLMLIRANSKEESLAMVKRVLNNEAGAWRDIVCLNAGAALLVSGIVSSFEAGVRLAESTIASGAAKSTFEQTITLTHALGTA